MEIISELINQYGGVAGIISLIVTAGYAWWKSRKDEKYKLKLDKELESFKTDMSKGLELYKKKLDNKNYINKVKFEKEFELYQCISQKEIGVAFYCGTIDKLTHECQIIINNKDDFINKFVLHIDEANSFLKCYAPFIDKEIFEKYELINSKAIDIYEAFYWLCHMNYNQINDIFSSKEYTVTSAKEEIERKYKEISELFDDVHKCIRERLAELESV